MVKKLTRKSRKSIRRTTRKLNHQFRRKSIRRTTRKLNRKFNRKSRRRSNRKLNSKRRRRSNKRFIGGAHLRRWAEMVRGNETLNQYTDEDILGLLQAHSGVIGLEAEWDEAMKNFEDGTDENKICELLRKISDEVECVGLDLVLEFLPEEEEQVEE